MTHTCPIHGCCLAWHPDAQDHVCGDCSHDAARRGMDAATDEANVVLAMMDAPERGLITQFPGADEYPF